MQLDILHTLNAERAARRAVVVVTDVGSGAQRLVKADEVAHDPLREVIEKRLRMVKSGMEETAGARVFLTVHVPSPQLVITGAVHISQTLAPIGQMLGYDVTIVDPRTAFASSERFPDVTTTLASVNEMSTRLNASLAPGRGDIALTLSNVRQASDQAKTIDVKSINATLRQTQALMEANQAKINTLIDESTAISTDTRSRTSGAAAGGGGSTRRRRRRRHRRRGSRPGSARRTRCARRPPTPRRAPACTR